MKIIEYIHAHGPVKNGDLMRLYGISRKAAGKELMQMVENNVIRVDGKGRATLYVMAKAGCRFRQEYQRVPLTDNFFVIRSRLFPVPVRGFKGKDLSHPNSSLVIWSRSFFW
jgi:predicted transcriptional regulator